MNFIERYGDPYREKGISESVTDQPTIYIFSLRVTIIMVLVMYSPGDLDRYNLINCSL